MLLLEERGSLLVLLVALHVRGHVVFEMGMSPYQTGGLQPLVHLEHFDDIVRPVPETEK